MAFNDAAIDSDNHLLVPVLDNGNVWLCGRVRSIDDGLATVRVKTKLHNRPRFWDVSGTVADAASVVVGSKSLFRGHISHNGQLMLEVDQVVKPSERHLASVIPKLLLHPRHHLLELSKLFGGRDHVAWLGSHLGDLFRRHRG